MGQGSRVTVSCGVGHRRGLDPALLWVGSRLAALALIRPVAWELPNASDVALKRKRKKKKKKKKRGRGKIVFKRFFKINGS